MSWHLDTKLLPDHSQDFRILRRKNAVKIELARPEARNSLTATLVSGLRDAYDTIARDPSIFRVYLTGQGRVFCAGMNLSPTASPSSSDHLAQLRAFRDLLAAIERSPQVTIALINGPCYGGGNGLAFANDIRVCVRSATFLLTEARLGLAPCAISPVLAREWGLALTRSAMLTARPVTAQQLQSAGAVFAVADDVEKMNTSLLDELEAMLGACAPGASTVCKELVRVAWTDPGAARQDEVVEERYLEMMKPSAEARHGMEQFRQGVREVDWSKLTETRTSRGSRL